MIKKLTIQQFVIIDRLELDFLEGLTILTGETGAGKSILLDATGLVLGEPSDPESIRQGASESLIEAIIAPPPSNPSWDFLKARGLAGEGETQFTVRRVVRRSGNDDVMVNDKNIALDDLKKLGTFLCEIHGQFANQSMLEPSNQLTLLDLSGNFPREIFQNVIDSLNEVRRLEREIAEEDDYLTKNRNDLRRIENLVGRFDKLGMREGFVEEVDSEYNRLLTAKKTSEAFQAILSQLIAANGVIMSLSGANQILSNNENLEAEKMATLAGFLDVSLVNARAAVKEMRRLAPDYEIDLRPLERYTELLTALQAISRETKIDYFALPTFYEDISVKLNRLKSGRETMTRLEDELGKAKRAYIHHSHILHEKRVAAGLALSETITQELPPLKLMRAEFQVKVEEKANIEWTERGLDVVTFTARMNPGMPFSPVAETASGGELARLILALKVVLQKVQIIPTLIFDEVDTGIGGAAAAAVGERIAQLADQTQVLVITHSPQVASRSDQHLHVSKKSDGVTTTSDVRRLSVDERVDEISRMLAGDVITPESKAAAQSLMTEARNAAQKRRELQNA